MKPRIMGVLNCTPDSFYDGGLHQDLIGHGMRLIRDGADIIDIGGESTRPNADTVDAEEEIRRVIPVIKALAPHTVVSIDTTKPRVARAALKAGAQMLNDVRGLQNTELQRISADFASCVIMHSRGTPKNMQQLVDYDDIGHDVTQWLLRQAERCKSSEIILDPGIGFAKTTAQSLRLIRVIDRLAQHGFPVLLGASRKSFIGQTLDRPDVKDRLAGSLAAIAAGYARGVKLFRVHDVRESRDIVDLLWAIDHATT